MSAVAKRGPVALLNDLEAEGKLTLTALVLTEEIDFDRYEALCRYLGQISDSSNWWLGDLFLYGENVFGDNVHQAIMATGKSPDMLQRCITVAQRIPPGRRHPELSWSHHRDVAHLEPDEQDAWLEKALEERWTRTELGAQLHPKPDPPPRRPCENCHGTGWVPDEEVVDA